MFATIRVVKYEITELCRRHARQFHHVEAAEEVVEANAPQTVVCNVFIAFDFINDGTKLAVNVDEVHVNEVNHLLLIGNSVIELCFIRD